MTADRDTMRASFPEIAAVVDDLRRMHGPTSVRVLCVADHEGNVLAGRIPPGYTFVPVPPPAPAAPPPPPEPYRGRAPLPAKRR